MEYKLIAIDLDGTMITRDHRITDENMEAVRKLVDCGVKVVISTGRAYGSAKKFVERLGLTTEEDYVIAYQGCKIYRPFNDEKVFEIGISNELVQEVIEFAKGYDIGLVMYEDTELLSQQYHESIATYVNAIEMPLSDIKFDPNNSNITKIITVGEREQLEKMVANIPKHLIENTNSFFSHSNMYEFISKDANKGLALKRLCDMLGIDMKDTVAIGDNGNDIELVKMAGFGVAMNNAYEGLKDIADYITVNDNNNSGVAEVINMLWK